VSIALSEYGTVNVQLPAEVADLFLLYLEQRLWEVWGAGRLAAPGRGDARRAEDPPDRGTTDREALHGDELLCEVVVVQARVAPAGVGHDLGLERLRQSPRGAPTPGSVREARWTPLAERSPETAHLRWGESQRFGGLRGGDPAALEQGEYVQSMSLLGGQCHQRRPRKIGQAFK
jgi:hypothetical protein